MPHTLTRLLACAAPPIWFAGLLALIYMQSLQLRLFLLPCALLFLYSAVAAWRATRNSAEANAIGTSTQIGLHLGGVWVLPYAMIAMLTLVSYERLLPGYLAMLFPALAYVVRPGDARRFVAVFSLSFLIASIATWIMVAQHLHFSIVPRLVITIESVVGCTIAAMPVWTLLAYVRLARLHQNSSRITVMVIVLTPPALVASAFALLMISMSGWTD